MNQDNEKQRWAAYYKAATNRVPSETLVKALELIQAEEPFAYSGFAIDLGCGMGRDTVALLQRDWLVLAMDGQEQAIEEIWKYIPPEAQERLEARVATFEQLADIGLPEADLINASFSLPFCHPDHFDALWAKIVKAIRPGGYFSGQFFGPNDTWASNPAMNFHSYEEALALLEPFEVEVCREEENDGSTAMGDQKHWHIIWIVARKRDKS